MLQVQLLAAGAPELRRGQHAGASPAGETARGAGRCTGPGFDMFTVPLVLQTWSGFFFPKYAAIAGVWYIVSRGMYTGGYKLKGEYWCSHRTASVECVIVATVAHRACWRGSTQALTHARWGVTCQRCPSSFGCRLSCTAACAWRECSARDRCSRACRRHASLLNRTAWPTPPCALLRAQLWEHQRGYSGPQPLVLPAGVLPVAAYRRPVSRTRRGYVRKAESPHAISGAGPAAE